MVRIAEVLNSLETEEITSMDLMNSLEYHYAARINTCPISKRADTPRYAAKKRNGVKGRPSTFTVWISNFNVTVQPQAKRL